MAEIALPRQQVTQTPQSAGIGSPLYQRRRTSNAGPIELFPNPEFSFPQQPVPGAPSPKLASASNSRPMSLQVYPTARRGSTPGARQKSVSALPDFSFNPSGTTKASGPASATPPHSPTAAAAPASPSRVIGHRRGGSEFIGGDGRSGGANVLSTSPGKGEGILPPPNANLRPGPPAGRRGHAHRRSGAVSSHDLSSIMQPPVPTAPLPLRTGSAPATPMDNDIPPLGHNFNRSLSQPFLHNEEFGSDTFGSTRRPVSRARVGFSDKVEYIRPLSTISSETETSMSTYRGHSATGSLSSVISNGASSPHSIRMGGPSLETTLEDDGRPSTAGAILDNKPRQSGFGGDLFSRKRPVSSAGPGSPASMSSPPTPNLPAKKRGFFQSRRSDSSVPTLKSCNSDPILTVSTLESPLPSPTKDSACEGEVASNTDKLKACRKTSRRPRKVKSWANSFIGRKGKQGQKGKGRPPTPPAPTSSSDEDESEDLDFEANFEANFDVDNTVTIVSPSQDTIPQRKLDSNIASWKPRELKRVDSDTMSPVIDLDAALGPFNTPLGSSPRTQQRGFLAHRRAMHSAGMAQQSHRRTESAPELVPFEHKTVAVGMAPTMADVFEEDEPEEDSEDNEPASPANVLEKEEEVEDPKIQVVEAADIHNGSTINWNFDDGLGIQRAEKSPAEESEMPSPLTVPVPRHQSRFSRKDNGSQQSLVVSPLEVVEDYEEPRASSLTRSSDSTVTPTLAPQVSKEAPPVLNFSLPLPPNSLMTPDTVTSTFSSPAFLSSQTSLDTPRLGTSASSITDYRTMHSPHFGEPGPELRVSVDDVPSLTSSRSTMTSGLPHGFPLPGARRPSDRSASLCSAPGEFEGTRRKRSSIASLSRLINGSGSFGEKSKLSIEQRPQSEYLEPAKKEKKPRRFSKLINYFKPGKDTPKA